MKSMWRIRNLQLTLICSARICPLVIWNTMKLVSERNLQTNIERWNTGYLLNGRRTRFSSFSFNIKSPDSNRASKWSGLTAVGLSTEWTRSGSELCGFSKTPYAESGEELGPDISNRCSCVDATLMVHKLDLLPFPEYPYMFCLDSSGISNEEEVAGVEPSLSHRRSRPVAVL